MTDHGYTTHGHSLPGKTQHPENRPEVTNCGGPIICKQCRQEVKEAMRQMFKPGPSKEATEDHAQDLGDFPTIEIQCDEEYETNSGEWVQCEKAATHMITLEHILPGCQRYVISQCDQHAQVTIHNVNVLQQHLFRLNMRHDEIHCFHCDQVLYIPDDIGRITRL